MFPITHIWFSRKVLGRINNMTVLGAIFPDTVTRSFLTHEQAHNPGWGLYDYIKEHSEEHLDFARALVTHTVNPRGLDFYSDEKYGDGYKGYCFQKAAEIEKEVIEACNIPESLGLWKAHNFIEMGVEINIIDSERELLDVFRSSLEDSSLINGISSRLDRYFGLKNKSLSNCFKKLSHSMELVDSNSLANRYNTLMQVRHGTNIDVSKSSDIIEKSRLIVQEDFDSFIEFCAGKVADMLKEEHK